MKEGTGLLVIGLVILALLAPGWLSSEPLVIECSANEGTDDYPQNHWTTSLASVSSQYPWTTSLASAHSACYTPTINDSHNTQQQTLREPLAQTATIYWKNPSGCTYGE